MYFNNLRRLSQAYYHTLIYDLKNNLSQDLAFGKIAHNHWKARVKRKRAGLVWLSPCSKMKCDTLEGNFKGEVRIPIWQFQG